MKDEIELLKNNEIEMSSSYKELAKRLCSVTCTVSKCGNALVFRFPQKKSNVKNLIGKMLMSMFAGKVDYECFYQNHKNKTIFCIYLVPRGLEPEDFHW